MLRDRQEAEDVVQEAALKAWGRVRQFQGEDDMKPWFLAIVANQSRSVRRSKWWSVMRAPETSADLQSSEDGLIDHADLRQALMRLKHEDRLALVMRYYLDLSFEEIASVLHVSVEGAKSRIYRSLKKLRPALVVSEPLV
jgi:RNA polymerase sigma-70 factor (ECF subfamily)